MGRVLGNERGFTLVAALVVGAAAMSLIAIATLISINNKKLQQSSSSEQTLKTMASNLALVLGTVLATLAGSGASFGRGAGTFVLGSMILTAILGIFTTPLLVAVFVTVYQDLVLRKEGGDLEARLGALPKG